MAMPSAADTIDTTVPRLHVLGSTEESGATAALSAASSSGSSASDGFCRCAPLIACREPRVEGPKAEALMQGAEAEATHHACRHARARMLFLLLLLLLLHSTPPSPGRNRLILI